MVRLSNMDRRNVSKKYSADVIVVGSGAGGSVAALTLADAGKRVIIVEKEAVGGDCANYSCIPTKALLETAAMQKMITQAPAHGIKIGNVKLSYEAAIHSVNQSIHSTGVLHPGHSPYDNANIQLVRGQAHCLDKHTISVDLTRYTAANIIIASGSTPFVPKIPGLQEIDYITYRTFAKQKTLPPSVAIIGGGTTAYEYAQIYAAFGVKTHVFESHYHLFSSFDSEVGDLAESALTNTGVRIHTAANITKVHTTKNGNLITFSQAGQEHHVSVDSIFVAAGNIPNTDIGLENAGVLNSEEGIRVNKRLQTSQKNIFAIGDVTGNSHSASSAVHQGLVTAHNILHRKKIMFQDHAVPRVAYGMPEIVVVGKTERQLKLTGLPYQTSIAPLGIVGKAHTSAYTSGFVKIVASYTGHVVGVSIVAPQASEFASELTFAIQHRHRACDIANTIHPFSSWSEAVRVAASKIYCT